ncbi:MAG TPA: hypothetical protein PLP29_07280 [Candidatus Ozemobacteraceae bacterium]|nr:hypothetical protein [Candidatus Ozemobacteraceae bacterium]
MNTVARPLPGALAGPLRRGRDRFNAAFFVARQAVPALDPESFADGVRELGTVAETIAGHEPDRLDTVVAALYDLTLMLHQKGLLAGPGRPEAFGRLWNELLPAVHVHLAAAPEETAGRLVNALCQLEATPGVRTGEWIDRLIAVVNGLSGRAELFDAGRLLAWRCGMAHQREAALDAAGRVSERILRACLGLSTDDLAQLRADPWLDPAKAGAAGRGGRKRLQIVAETGGFRGFGGPFATPPLPFLLDGSLAVRDAENVWRLHADVFGTVFRKYAYKNNIENNTSASAARVTPEGVVTWNGAKARFERISKPSGIVCDGTTIAVTLSRSHRVLLIAMAAEPGEDGTRGRRE